MTPLPFGVSQYTTLTQSFAQDLQLYCEANITFIEVCEAKLDAADPETQLQQLKDSGLTVSSVQPRLHSLFPDFPRPEPRMPRERMGHLRKTIELFGRHFPGVTLVTISGAAPNGDYGVRLALEPLNPILMNIDTFLCSLTHAGRVIESVNHPQFGLFLDVWHVWEDANTPALIEKYGAKIFGVHINDWRDPRAFGDRHLPGEGVIPLVDLLKAIRKTGYAGAYTLEMFSETHLPGSHWTDPRRTVFEGKEAFARIWEQVCA